MHLVHPLIFQILSKNNECPPDLKQKSQWAAMDNDYMLDTLFDALLAVIIST